MKRWRNKAAEKDRVHEEGAWVPWLFLLPSLLAVSIFVVVPFADVVRRSFFSAIGGKFVGFQNYISVFHNQAFQLAARNTAKFTAVCIPLLLVVSLLLALLLDAVRERRGILKTSFLIPLTIPAASMVLLWKVIFHENGLLNRMLDAVGIAGVDWLNTSWAFGVLVGTYLWKNAGYNMILWLSGITAIPPSLHESAALDGAGSWKRLWHITLPNLAPTFFYRNAVLSVLNSFKVFREAYLLAGSYPDDSIYLLQHLFNNWFLNLDVDMMCAGAVLMALVVFLLLALLQQILGRLERR